MGVEPIRIKDFSLYCPVCNQEFKMRLGDSIRKVDNKLAKHLNDVHPNYRHHLPLSTLRSGIFQQGLQESQTTRRKGEEARTRTAP